MTISEFHKQQATVPDRKVDKNAPRGTRPAQTNQNRGLYRSYRALKRQQAEERNAATPPERRSMRQAYKRLEGLSEAIDNALA